MSKVRIAYAEDTPMNSIQVKANVIGVKKNKPKELWFTKKVGEIKKQKAELTHYVNVENFMLEIQNQQFNYDIVLLDDMLADGIQGRKFAKLLKANDSELKKEKIALEADQKTSILTPDDIATINKRHGVEYLTVLNNLIATPQRDKVYVSMISSEKDLEAAIAGGDEQLSNRGIDYTSDKFGINLHKHFTQSANCPYKAVSKFKKLEKAQSMLVTGENTKQKIPIQRSGSEGSTFQESSLSLPPPVPVTRSTTDPSGYKAENKENETSVEISFVVSPRSGSDSGSTGHSSTGSVFSGLNISTETYQATTPTIAQTPTPFVTTSDLDIIPTPEDTTTKKHGFS